MLVDVHAHLDFQQFDPDRDEVIERAKRRGVRIINSGLGTTGIRKTLEIIEKHDNVYATLGLTPTEFRAEEIDATIKLIRENREKIVGIGEVGLDYYWVKEEDKRREEVATFKRFIGLSRELKLPLVIHSRDAEEDVLRVLGDEGINALLHCFGGSAGLAEKAASEGHIISIPANIANSKQKQSVAKAVPLTSLVLETDAPYLPPTPKTRNEPVNIETTAKKIAEIKCVDLSVVEEATTRNAEKFFNLPFS